VSVTPVIDAIEGRGLRQEIRRELLCKLQQKLSARSLKRRPTDTIFRVRYLGLGSTMPILSTPLHAR